MINAISNNFGCGPISIKDYQDDNLIVLNTKFTFDPSNEDYRAADVLEIKVPSLSLEKSGEAACYMTSHELMWPDTSYKTDYKIGTCLKTWIKNRNTICVEKLPIYDDLDDITIWICSMYPVVGKRGEFAPFAKANVTYNSIDAKVRASDLVCVVSEGWCFLHMYYYSQSGFSEDTPVVADLDGFPTDVDLEFPILGGFHQAGHPGTFYANANIQNGRFTIPSPSGRLSSTGYDPFVMIYAVRG